MESFSVSRIPNDQRSREFDQLRTSQALKTVLLNWVAVALRYPNLEIRRAVLLYGEPGTGKTTIGRSLGSAWAKMTGQNALQVDANLHALPSGERGGSQKQTLDFFEKIRELASGGKPTFVLMDEVETCLANRAQVSFETNPLDTLFAINAVFEATDALAREYPNTLLVATTNMPGKLDRAGLERFDLVEHVAPPDSTARIAILADGLRSVGASDLVPLLSSADTNDPMIAHLTELTAGYSGRRLKQLVFHALVIAEGTGGCLSLECLRLAAEKELETHNHHATTKGVYTYDWQRQAS